MFYLVRNKKALYLTRASYLILKNAAALKSIIDIRITKECITKEYIREYTTHTHHYTKRMYYDQAYALRESIDPDTRITKRMYYNKEYIKEYTNHPGHITLKNVLWS